MTEARFAGPADEAGSSVLLDRLQLARTGTATLDAAVGDALGVAGAVRWTQELGAAVGLLPPMYNYSLGRRDGVCWAWVQPNDGWEPNAYEARHDHPRGSGLVVAHTAALAVTCAAVILARRAPPAPG